MIAVGEKRSMVLAATSRTVSPPTEFRGSQLKGEWGDDHPKPDSGVSVVPAAPVAGGGADEPRLIAKNEQGPTATLAFLN